MFAELIMPSPSAAERVSFASLMELYECNYIALRRLCPDFSGLDDVSVSRLNGTPPLYLRVLERSRYTTTIELTQRIGDAGRTPVLPLRIYHDARQAEVLIAGVHPEGLSCDPAALGTRQRELAVCWQANSFLLDWLKHCLAQGHRFPASAVSAP